MVVQCSPGLTRRHPGIVWRYVLLGLFSVCLLISCDSGGDTGTPPASPDPTDLRFVQQGITEVLSVYRSDLLHEDSDRLQTLLHVEDDPLQDATQPARCPELATHTAAQFRADITTRLSHFSVLALDTRVIDMDLTPDSPSVLLQETLSFEDVKTPQDATRRAQRTCVSHLTLRLTRQPLQEGGPGTAFLIKEITREGPLFQVEMPGQARSGALTRVEVTETTGTFLAHEVRLSMAGGQETVLLVTDNVFHGAFVLPARVPPEPLQVSIRGDNGEEIVLHHAYRLRMPGDRVVQQIAGTTGARLLAVTLASDGTVWAGGDRGATLYQVAPEATQATPIASRPSDPAVRVEDLTVDRLGRLHAVVFSPLRSGVILYQQGEFCQTVNVFDREGRPDPAYPFRVRDLESGELWSSPSTRVIAAGGGDIWLFGSDGGVARVADDVQRGPCTEGEEAIAVHYDPIFRRQDEPEGNRLLTNTVPALVAGADGALWFGTALGLMRWQEGRFTPLPFDRTVSLAQGQFSSDQLDTLESLILTVATAIFEAKPIETVKIGGVSFLDFFGRTLVKEDFVFSAVEDHQGHLWVGTLGGGIRRIEAVGDTFRDTLHLTRTEVIRIDPDSQERTPVNSQGQIVSNIIFALAVDPDGAVWAATDKGVSRIQELRDGTFIITTFSALDGLALPVRDVAVSEAGTVWLATDGGLFQLTLERGQLQGMVHDLTDTISADIPVAEADVIIRDTPFRAVTDPDGYFELAALPAGRYIVQVLGERANGGPFTDTFRDLTLDLSTQILEPLIVVRREPRVPIDPVQGDTYRFPTVPGAEIVIASHGVWFPTGIPPEIGLTPLPVSSLHPLPNRNWRFGAAAELQPDGINLTKPFELTLPNQEQLSAANQVFLACLRVQGPMLTYSNVGRGRVNQDGMTITGGGEMLNGCTIVVFFLP